MTLALWYAALFAIAAGTGIALFWGAALATDRAGRLLDGRTDAAGHVAAEFVTAALLVAGGVATIVRPDEGWTRVVYGFGGGALLYTLVEAPFHYARRGMRAVAWALLLTAPLAVAAFVARIAA